VSPTKPTEDKSLEPGSLLPQVRRILVGLAALGLVVFVLTKEGQFTRKLRSPSRMVDVNAVMGNNSALCGPPPLDGRPVVVDMLFSDDKQDWLYEAGDRFSKLCPGIQVRLTPMGDIQSADAILSGEQNPTLWSPADDLIVRYLDHSYRQRMGKPLFAKDNAPSLAKSPMVVLIWADRLLVVESILAHRPGSGGEWAEAMCAGIPKQVRFLQQMTLEDKVPGTWIDWYNPEEIEKKPVWALPRPQKKPSRLTGRTYAVPFPTLEEMKSWGQVKFVHTSPTRSAAGLEVLYLMSYDYVLPPTERPAALREELLAARRAGPKEGVVIRGDKALSEFKEAFPKYQRQFGHWLERCEAGLGPAPESTKLLTDEMFHVGPSRYDAVITYEHLVFEIFRRFDEHADNMPEIRVIYPQPTLMNAHPAVLIESDDITPAEREAAGRWIDFLRSREQQEVAITYGFRPAIEDVTIRDYKPEKNPFLQFRRYGVRFDVPTLEPPRAGGDIIMDLVRIWQDATGRN